jgi:hypothetical protein
MARLDDVLNKRVMEANRLLKLLFPDGVVLTPTIIGRKVVYEATGVLNLFSMLQFKVDGIREKFVSGFETAAMKFQVRLDTSL